MKKIGMLMILLGISFSGYSQVKPYLQVDVRQNFLTQKIDFLDGPKVLSKAEMQSIMAESTVEIADLYRRSMAQQQIATIFAVAGLATTLGTAVYIISPQQQSSQTSNLFWPLLISSLALEIGGGIFNRNSRNLAREAVDSYNFGRSDQPIYFEENRIDIPLFSHVVHF